MDLFTAHHACVHIYNQDTEELELRVWKGGSPEFLNSISQMKLGEGLVGMVAELGEALALNIDDFPEGTRSVVAADGIGCVAAIPMKSRGRLLGVIGVASEETNRFSQADLNLLGAITGQGYPWRLETFSCSRTYRNADRGAWLRVTAPARAAHGRS